MRFTVPIFLLLSACASDPSDFDGQLNCGAERFSDLLGKREAALEAVTLPSRSRILRPGDAITLDFSPDRLTIDIDDQGFIASVTCR